MQDMRLGDYMALLTSAEATHYYLADEEIKTALPELWGDIGAPPLFDRRLLVKTGMFLGRDTVDGMHCHPIHQVLVCQITGERQIDLFEPDDGQLFEPAPWYSPNFNWSTLDFDRVDPGRKHEFEERRYSTILRPGEMLFIPVQWWNLMRGPGFNASVCLIWHAEFRDWTPRSSARVVAAGLVNNPLVRPFVLPWLQRRFEPRAAL
jgi:hypothetical protein